MKIQAELKATKLGAGGWAFLEVRLLFALLALVLAVLALLLDRECQSLASENRSIRANLAQIRTAVQLQYEQHRLRRGHLTDLSRLPPTGQASDQQILAELAAETARVAELSGRLAQLQPLQSSVAAAAADNRLYSDEYAKMVDRRTVARTYEQMLEKSILDLMDKYHLPEKDQFVRQRQALVSADAADSNRRPAGGQGAKP